jgi:hypothetical protein
MKYTYLDEHDPIPSANEVILIKLAMLAGGVAMIMIPWLLVLLH